MHLRNMCKHGQPHWTLMELQIKISSYTTIRSADTGSLSVPGSRPGATHPPPSPSWEPRHSSLIRGGDSFSCQAPPLVPGNAAALQLRRAQVWGQSRPRPGASPGHPLLTLLTERLLGARAYTAGISSAAWTPRLSAAGTFRVLRTSTDGRRFFLQGRKHLSLLLVATARTPARRYLHGGVVVRVQGALGHSREGLADEQLGERGLRAPHHRGQDVDGRLQETRQAASGAGREGPMGLPTHPETLRP